MNSQHADHPDANTLLSAVEEGMFVYDAHDQKIGRVNHVQPAAGGPGEAESQPLRERLLKTGFIHIDTGRLHEDCYATPAQIAGVIDGNVRLRVPRDELLTL